MKKRYYDPREKVQFKSIDFKHLPWMKETGESVVAWVMKFLGDFMFETSYEYEVVRLLLSKKYYEYIKTAQYLHHCLCPGMTILDKLSSVPSIESIDTFDLFDEHSHVVILMLERCETGAN